MTLTEAEGVVVGLCVEGANRHDMKLTGEALETLPPILGAKRDEWVYGPLEVPQEDTQWLLQVQAQLTFLQEEEWQPDVEWPQEPPQVGLCLDAGFDYDEVREVAAGLGYTTHIVARGEEKKAKEAGHKARRWVVERAHSWLNRYRRLLVRWEKKAQNFLALLHLACAHLTWNKCLFG